MPEVENFQDSAQHCFEVASSSNFLEEDVASTSIRVVDRQRV